MNVRKARALIAIGADSKQLDRDLAKAKKKVGRFQRDVKKIGRAAKAIGGGLLGGVGLAGGMGISGIVTNTVSDAFDFDKALTRFQIAAGKSNADMARLRQSILEVSKATGVGSAQVLAGAQTYVDLTGDVSGAEKAMSSFARVAQASGAEVSEVATATAAMQMSGKLAADDIEAVWSGLITQGKAGAVSVKDMAGELSTLMPMMAKFAGGTGADGIRDMGAAFQVVRRGAGSAAEASVKLQSLVGSLIKNSSKLRSAGINVFKLDPKTKRRELIAFRDIVGQIAKKRFDAEKLGKVLGTDKESLQAIDMLTQELSLYDQLTEAGKDRFAVERDLATFQQSSAGKLEIAFARMKAKAAEALTPERAERFGRALVFAVESVDTALKVIDELPGLFTEAGRERSAENKRTIADFERRRGFFMAGVDKSLPAEAQESAAMSEMHREDQLRQRFGAQIAGIDWARSGDTGRFGETGRENVYSVDELKSLIPVVAQGSNWQTMLPMLQRAITTAMRDAMQNQKVVVQTDGNQIAKTVDNAADRRRPQRPR